MGIVKMALYQLLCGLTVMINLLSKGCHSEQPVCGVAKLNPRIVGGQDASPGSWPWQASISDRGLYICSGSLISDQWVLTAAHCITGSPNIEIHLGRHNQSGPNPNEMARNVNMSIRHPEYDSFTSDHDIGLMKLSSPVNFTDYIQPICLASMNSTFHAGTTSWAAGWGFTQPRSFPDILQEVDLKIVGNNECQCNLSFPITENMMCAGGGAGGKDTCQGDSGGALLTKMGSYWVQGGVTSFGFGCARRYSPGAYARVSQYQTWITMETGQNIGFVTFNSPGVDSDLYFTCPTYPPAITTTAHPYTTEDPSIFGSGENVFHFTHFISVCVLVLSLYVLVGDT